MKIFSNIDINIHHILSYPINLSENLNHVLGVMLFAILMTLGAFVRIHLPFTPVPITLQTLFMLLSGAFLGCGWGTVSMGFYLILGALGLPVFAGASSGILYILGPTGGYLLGFMIGAWIVGHIIGSGSCPSWKLIISSFSLATISLYVLGITQLMLWSRTSLKNALFMGFIPFIPGDILKILLAASILKLSHPISRSQRKIKINQKGNEE
ncbi:biotin transporter BioY [bacterium]|nr:biotin transporter BioY [bacterium]